MEDWRELSKELNRCSRALERRFEWVLDRAADLCPQLLEEYEARYLKQKKGRKRQIQGSTPPEKLLTVSQKKPSKKKRKPRKQAVNVPEKLLTINSVDQKEKRVSEEKQKTHELIVFWVKNYKAVYGNNPPMPGKQQGVLRRLHKDFGLERAKLYLEAYLRIKEQWYVKKRHSLDQLESNLNAVEQFISNGRIVTSKTAQQIETDQHNQAAMEAASNDGSIPF